MTKSSLTSALVLTLILSILFVQVSDTFALNDGDKIRIAFVGIKFQNLPEDIKEIILWRMTQTLQIQQSVLLLSPEVLQLEFGSDKIATLVSEQDAKQLLAFGSKNRFDYVFSGELTNSSDTHNSIALNGELNRFDMATEAINSYAIQNRYDDFGNELLKFRTQYIDTLELNGGSRSKTWTKLFIGSIIVAGALAVRFLAGPGFGGESSEASPTSTDE